MLAALRPDVDLTQGPFERWVREHGPDVAGRLGLVLANPPYGQRGAAVTEDPDRAYREKAAYAYFLRRALDLLAPNGLGVFLVPGGFLSGGSDALRSLREKVLLRHHLATAYRLPSKIFPGAMLVTDLLFFRARGGALTEVDVADRSILDGRYFLDHPEHVLGTEVGKDAGDDDQTRKPRWGYQVVGTFERLPDLHERPICDACTIDRNVLVFPGASTRSRPAPAAPEGLSDALATAFALGQRVDRYLAALSAQTTDEHVQLWPELVEALNAWTKAHGNPWAATDLRKAAAGQRPFERVLQAFTKSGALIAGLATRPTWTPRYAGRPDDLVALAEWVYRTQRHLTHDTLAAALPNGGRADVIAGLPGLMDAGWCLDGDAWDELVPERDYLTGHLWPKHQRAVALSEKHEPKRVLQNGAVWGVVPVERIATQARRLIETIAPALLDDITGVSPRQGWVPLDLVSSWLSEALNPHYGAVRLERREGLVQVPGVDYDRIDDASDLSAEARWCVGWINHDRTTFSPKKRKDENIDEVCLRWAREWEQAFRAWVARAMTRDVTAEDGWGTTSAESSRCSLMLPSSPPPST
jgi:hypothetical protein